MVIRLRESEQFAAEQLDAWFSGLGQVPENDPVTAAWMALDEAVPLLGQIENAATRAAYLDKVLKSVPSLAIDDLLEAVAAWGNKHGKFTAPPTPSPSAVEIVSLEDQAAATILNWTLYGQPDRFNIVSELEAADFPQEWQRKIYGWISSNVEDGIQFTGAGECLAAAEENGLGDEWIREGGKPKLLRVGDVTTLMRQLDDGNHIFMRDIRCTEAMKANVEILRKARGKKNLSRMIGELVASSGNFGEYKHKITAITEEMDSLESPKSEVEQKLLPSEVVRNAVDSIEDGALISTGYEKLDAHIGGGIPRGDVVVINGCTSTGKTCVLLNILRRGFTNRPDDPTVLISVEMPNAQVWERHLQDYTYTNKEHLRRCIMDSETHPWPNERTPEKFDVLARNYTIIDDTSIFSIPKIVAKLRTMDKPPVLIGIDYLQLLAEPSRAAEGSVQRIEQNMYAIKRMAKEFDAAVIVLSQVPREQHADPSKALFLRSGKGSGAIEDAADFVLGIWRPFFNSEVMEEKSTSSLKAGIFKNRHGPVGEVSFELDLEKQRLREL